VLTLGLLAMLAATGDLAEWFALRMNGVDSSRLAAHDGRSGVVVHCTSSASNDPTKELAVLLNSPRLRRHRVGATGSYTWDQVVLSDPRAFGRRLLDDIGRTPPPGSWEAAWVDAWSPSVECDREVQYFLRKANGSPLLLSAVPCNASQRGRTQSFAAVFMAGVSPPELAVRQAFGPTRALSQDDLVWLNARPSAREVLARLGTPSDIWPKYPDGFSLLYRAAGAPDDSYAVDFTRTRSVSRVRPLTPMTGAP